jgi:hypothetical protein
MNRPKYENNPEGYAKALDEYYKWLEADHKEMKDFNLKAVDLINKLLAQNKELVELIEE